MPQKGVSYYPLLADKEWLRRKHVDEGLDQVSLAKIVGCSVAGMRAALMNAGCYQPKRRKDFGQRLAHISAARMVVDAGTVCGWNGLGDMYGVQRTVVQNHAYALNCFEEVQGAFLRSRPRRPAEPPPPNAHLASPSWLATAWAQSYSLLDVAEAAGTDPATVRAWMKFHGMTLDELRYARDAALVIEYLGGQLLKPLAASHNLDPAGVWRVLARAGVETSRNRKAKR